MKRIFIFIGLFLFLFSVSGCQNDRPLEENEIKITVKNAELEGENYKLVEEKLKEIGFIDIEFEIIYDLTTGWLVSDGEVEKVTINGDSSFKVNDIFKNTDKVIIEYHTFKSNKPVDPEHDTSWMPKIPQISKEDKMVTLTVSHEELEGKKYEDVVSILGDLGFYNIKFDYIFDLNGGWLDIYDDGDVESITINGFDDFDKGDNFMSRVVVIITYHTMESNKPLTGNGYSFDFKLNSDGNTYCLTKYYPDNYFNEPTDVVVPATFLGLDVTEIGSQAFYARTDLEKVTLSEGLECIESYAFYHCDSLSEINFPSTFRRIMEYAFEGCDSLKELEFVQPTGINFRAFNDCDGLEKLVITGSSFIDDWAFEGCDKLTEVYIPGVTSIGGSAFRSSAIVTLTVSDALISIGDNAFHGCEKLKTMYIYGTPESFDPYTGPWWNLYIGNYETVYLEKNN